MLNETKDIGEAAQTMHAETIMILISIISLGFLSNLTNQVQTSGSKIDPPVSIELLIIGCLVRSHSALKLRNQVEYAIPRPIIQSQARIILIPMILLGFEPNLIDSTNISIVEINTATIIIKRLILIGLVVVVAIIGAGQLALLLQQCCQTILECL